MAELIESSNKVITLADWRKFSLFDILNLIEGESDKYDYMAALRGPDIWTLDGREDAAKFLVQGFIRGGGSPDGLVGMRQFDMMFSKYAPSGPDAALLSNSLQNSIKAVGVHYCDHVVKALIATKKIPNLSSAIVELVTSIEAFIIHPSDNFVNKIRISYKVANEEVGTAQ